MRQQHPPAGTIFLLCLQCDRAEWRRIGDGKSKLESRGETISQLPTPNSDITCRHCGGPTEQRYPLTLALTKEERGLINTVAAWGKRKTHDAIMHAVTQDFRKLATERVGKGKPLPQWAADWL